MLEARSLSKSYGRRKVVHDVSLDVECGEIVGLLGPNGAGKTTCFYMVVGLVPCTSGQIILDGTDITQANMHRRAQRGLGYLPQEASVFRQLSVRDNILAILELRPDLDRAGVREQLERLMDELHISHLHDQVGVALSGGERRRVEIARALAANPRYMLLDEPFAGVDPISISEIQGLVRALRERGLGVLITDHNVRETLGICDRACIISQGRVLTAGTPQEVLENAQVRETYLGRDFHL